MAAIGLADLCWLASSPDYSFRSCRRSRLGRSGSSSSSRFWLRDSSAHWPGPARREGFDFLGYTLGPRHLPNGGRWYLGASPSKKSVRRIKTKVGELLTPGNKGAWPEVRMRLNRLLYGWSAYFSYGALASAYEAADHPGDPSAQLRAWLKDMAAHVASGDERGCPLANAAVELPEKDHPARRVIEAFKTAQRERLVQLCAAAALAEPEMLADELFLLLGGVSRPWTEDGVRAHHLAAQRGGNLARRSHDCPSTILSRTAPMTPEAEPSLLRETAIIAALSAVMGLLLMSRRLFIVIRRGTSFAARPGMEDGKEPGDVFRDLSGLLARDLSSHAMPPERDRPVEEVVVGWAW